MHLRVSQKIFVCVAFVLFTLLPCHPMKTGVLFSDFLTLLLKFIIKSFKKFKQTCKFLSEGGPSLAHSKSINFIGLECPNFEEGWMEV